MIKIHSRFLQVLLIFFVFAIGVSAAPYMSVNGAAHDYLTLNYYIDEDEGDTETLYIEFWPDDANVEQAQVWSNLGRRDYATLDDQDAASVPGPDPASDSYFVGFPLTHEGGGKWTAELPIEKTGAYRLTARYTVSGDPDWRWVGGRDTAVMVSPKKARDVILYELMINVINATGDTEGTRSTFEDLTNPSKPANLDYFEYLGVNTLWIQPIHPIGEHECIDKSEGPGSPYSIQNMWEVAPHMSWSNTRPDAMAAFTNFAAEAGARGIDFFFDIIFNHTSWDAEIGRDPDDPTQPAANPTAEIRDILPQWYSRYVGGLSCDPSPGAWNQGDFHFDFPAEHAGQLGPAPAERIDFGKWPDVADLFWGTYPALFDPNTDTDAYWDMREDVGGDVKRMTEYFAYFAEYWIEKSGGTLGGFRCDYAQGIPPQAWEYIVNRTRQVKWDFIFMAESLDGGNVSIRAGRHMDIINQNWVWQVLDHGGNTTGLRQIIDWNKTDYGFAGIMRGIVNHDQNAPEDRWYTFSRYAVGAVVDGAPQMYQGQELGYTDGWGFSQFRIEHGREIPDIFKWHNMQTLWNNTDYVLQDAYARVNHGRMLNPATRLHEQWYLNQTGGQGPHQQIFSVLKYDREGWDPADQNVVLNFVNLTPWTQQTATFDLNEPNEEVIYINPTRYYNIRNLAGDDPSAQLWDAPGRTGQQLLDDGIWVNFPEDGNAYPEWAFVQMLVLEEHGVGPDPEPGIVWIGATHHTPPNGEIESTDNIIVYIESYPEGAAVSGDVVYSPDNGTTWLDEPLVWGGDGAGTYGQNDWWTANLGSFPAGSVIQYAVVLRDEDENETWDNNNGPNFIASVNSISLAITNPPSDIAVGNEVTTYTLQGVTDSVEGDLHWTNALTGASGDIPVAASWSIVDIALGVGANVITVRGEIPADEEEVVAEDYADRYDTETWTNDSNEATGAFGAWNMWDGGEHSGSFIWDSTEYGHGDINTDDVAFGMYGHSGQWSDAQRGITEWGDGYTFSIDVAVQWRDGDSGLNLYNTSDTNDMDEPTQIWNFNISDAGYGGSGFDYYSDIVLNIAVTQNGADLDILVTGSSAGESWSDTWSTNVTGETLGGLRLYTGGDFPGEDPQDAGERNLYFNNLTVTKPGTGEPEVVSASVTITRESDEEADSNGDGVPDWWYADYGLNPLTPNLAGQMADNGYTYGASFLMDLDPHDDTIPAFEMKIGENGKISFSAPDDGRRYMVQYTDDLMDPFEDIGEGVNVGHEIELNGDPRGFYRIRFLDLGE